MNLEGVMVGVLLLPPPSREAETGGEGDTDGKGDELGGNETLGTTERVPSVVTERVPLGESLGTATDGAGEAVSVKEWKGELLLPPPSPPPPPGVTVPVEVGMKREGLIASVKVRVGEDWREEEVTPVGVKGCVKVGVGKGDTVPTSLKEMKGGDTVEARVV
jgi:hypothetical protein